MAKLNSTNTTIAIIPVRRETPASSWVETAVILEYHIQDQRISFEASSQKVSLQIEDFERLISKTKVYIENLPILPFKIKQYLNSYYFTPLEGNFSLEFKIGYYFDDSRHSGIVFIDFKMNVNAIIDAPSDDKIGCVMKVEIKSLLIFLDDLEKELKALLA